ncbi:MAG: iron-containing alcohol dehydrogenase [Prevotella sp.]|nr:iron-containing alcohol dehydrogenase [Prevotella sp.]
MRQITLLQPQKIVFGTGCIQTLVEDSKSLGHKRLFILTAAPIVPLIEPVLDELKSAGISVGICQDIMAEPTVNDFKKILAQAREFGADSMAGIGGGSVLDLAKLVAALYHGEQKVEDCFGTGLVKAKGLWLACLPTTAGTGSEVSPNAILLDERDQLKKGVVSPYLMADVAYVDPKLTWTVPAKVTAETGMDALIHCIEAYTNKFAHPIIDVYALKGIELIAGNLETAVHDGTNQEAREALALGSMYGGLCLGPVNTAAVHALSYPIGGEYHISHGLANAILLPSVMQFNMQACAHRYADLALYLGAEMSDSDNDEVCDRETANHVVNAVYRLSAAIGIPKKLSDIGIPQSAVPHMAKAAMDVQRLLKNNPREVTEEDARKIYNSLY